MSEVIIYQAEDSQTALEVQLDQDTVWLSQRQMTELFEKDTDTVGLHIRNIFKEGELEQKATTEESSVVQKEGTRQVRRNVGFYNLDVIISVGYRVKSQRCTQFRQWATRVLREHLVKGYTINEQRLREERAKLQEMQRAIELLSRTLEQQHLVNGTGQEVLQVITDYAYALTTLDRYNHGTLAVEGTSGPAAFVLEYKEAIAIVQSMRGEFDGLFGQEKDQGFKSALGAIYQSFDGKDVYPSVEEKAANLLYFVVKITLSPTATNASPPSLFSFWRATASSTVKTAPSDWPTAPWWH